MRFMIIRKADADTEAGVLPDDRLIEDMGRYHEEMVAAGIMRAGEGLKPSAQGARVVFRDGKPTVIDGPFAETKELVAGFSLIEVATKEDALAWMLRWPTSDANGQVELELRPVYEMSDFGDGPGLEHIAELQEKWRA